MLPIEDATAASYNHSILYRRTLYESWAERKRPKNDWAGLSQ